ncbi:hypothetical protein [Roseomonas mucosa]
MDLRERLARRQGRREDLKAIAGLLTFLALILTVVVLPGFVAQDASTIRVPTRQGARP